VRFRELRLIAFGHFSNRQLTFEPSPKRVHIVYGHNEAGKSTALRAVGNLLFGVPQSSPDTFVHAGPDLRIGAVLEDEAGTRLEIVRRKGRKNTLLDPTGAALDEAGTLGPLLGSVDETLFRSMFGLDHETLRLGARELLSGAGSVSESLFGAGMAGGHTHRLLHDLRDQAEALFTSRGRGRKRINQQIAEVREAHKLVARQSTSAHAFQERKKDLAQANDELDRVKNERAKLTARKNLLARRLGILPLVARLRAVRAARAALGTLQDVPEALEEWRSEAVGAQQEAEAQAAFSQAEVERHQSLIAALNVPPALAELDARSAESLSQRLGQYRKAKLDLPKREAELHAIHDDARRLLADLDETLELEAADSLRLSKPEEQRIRRQCAEKVRLDAMLAEREISHRESQRVTMQRKRTLEGHGSVQDTTALAAALERARAQLDAEERLAGDRSRLRELERNLSERLVALGHVHGEGRVELDAAFPETSTVARFARELREADAQLARLSEKESAFEQEQIDNRRDIAELEAEGLVPSEAELVRLRAERDTAVSALRRALDANAASHETRAMLRTLEQDLQRSDQYGDRLRFEATRVAKKAQLDARAAAASERLASCRRRLSEAREQRAKAMETWRALWAPLDIEPLPPDEMSEWMSEIAPLAKAREHVSELQADLRRQEARLAALQKDLGQALEHLGEPARTLWESFPQYVHRAQATLQRLVASAHAASDDAQRLALAQEEEADQFRRLSELKETQRQFRNDWAKTLRTLGLDKDKTPDDVTFVLDQRGELVHRLSEGADLQRRIQGMLRDEKQLQDDVAELTSRVLPDLGGLPLETASERLLRAYKKATEDAREKLRLELELERHARDLRLARSRIDASKDRIRELLRLARVESLEDLALLEKRAQQARLLDRQCADLEDEILNRGEGEALDSLLERADEASAEQLREDMSQVEVELGILEDRLEGLVRRRTQAEASLSELGQGAADAAEELAQRTAALRASVRRYLRLRLASAILGREIERYRDENQGPVLRRASELFARLTLGAYQGLKTGYAADDEPILLCVARDGSEKHVEALSDGGRDQLYLSLRIATVLHLVERTRPMPLVLDDILIHFDDDRARAALSVLGEVAKTTQVLFFTHHARLVELARQAIADSELQVCDLASAPAGRQPSLAP
jgi:uncharacterized protein YhaN